MALQTAAIKNALASAYAAQATHASVTTTVPSGTAGTEHGSRAAISWGSPSGGVIVGTATLNVSGSTTIVGAQVHTASTSGTYLDGGAVTSQTFATSGTYALTITVTIT